MTGRHGLTCLGNTPRLPGPKMKQQAERRSGQLKHSMANWGAQRDHNTAHRSDTRGRRVARSNTCAIHGLGYTRCALCTFMSPRRIRRATAQLFRTCWCRVPRLPRVRGRFVRVGRQGPARLADIRTHPAAGHGAMPAGGAGRSVRGARRPPGRRPGHRRHPAHRQAGARPRVVRPRRPRLTRNSPACRFAAPDQHFSATVIRRSALVPPSPPWGGTRAVCVPHHRRDAQLQGARPRPADGDRDGPSPDRRRPGRNGRVKVVPVQVVRGDEPRAWTDIHAAIVDLLAGHLPATDRR